MSLIKIDKTISYQANPAINEDKNKDNNKNIEKNHDGKVHKDTNSLVISKNAEIGYEFLSRIEASFKGDDKSSLIEKYALEYEKIREEISSGKLGNNVKKYLELLDNAFKDSLKNAYNILGKSLEEANIKDNRKKFSGPTSDKYRKQHDTATLIAWVLRAENKRISEEIEYHKKKKNHGKVFQLNKLKNTYKRIINNVTEIAAWIRGDVDEKHSKDETKDSLLRDLDKF